MSRTLELLFDELGYHDPEKQLAVSALLERAGILNFEKAVMLHAVAALRAQATTPQSSSVQQPVLLDPAVIETNPEMYQFRFGSDKNGVTRGGRYRCDAWDPAMHGAPLLLHERLDGRMFVADGHHRLDLAKRLNSEGRGPGKVAVNILREADGYTALDAKIIAAYKNIEHGYTDPVEAAYVLKDAESSNVNKHLLPKLSLDKGSLPIAEKLARLTRKALSFLGAGKVPVEMGMEVALHVHDPVQQEAVLHIISKKLHGAGALNHVEKLQKQREKNAGQERG